MLSRNAVNKFFSGNPVSLYLYADQVVDQATHQLDGLMIAYFANVSQLEFYNLAFVIRDPIVLFSRALFDKIIKRNIYFAEQRMV